MTTRFLQLDDLPVVRWANGLGVTRAVLDEPGLRVSIATIHEAAAFSTFAGLQRLLVVIGPVEIELDIDGRPCRLHHGDGAAFSGSARVSVSATRVPTTVLNVIHDDRWESANTSKDTDRDDGLSLPFPLRVDGGGDQSVIALFSHGIAVLEPMLASPDGDRRARTTSAEWVPARARRM
ncbi:HutD family protein [Microbacteriaceae bacterium VKM Ac-2855]|nr:HutD family protein [Microbacteriaceae bacterium VKM Ac-2855]